jgi:malto-oligosyltrehalose trehalohydrolase
MMAGDFGARVVAPGRTKFRLWAPDCNAVDLLVDSGRHPMAKAPDGVFEITAACGDGARYLYQISPHQTVPDPASRLQSGGVHGQSVVVDQAYPWRNGTWRGRPWEEAVIYELHAGLLGGFAGVEAQLARLARLGITAIELMPIADFPGQHNWGYDGVLPYAPNCAYGTPRQLKSMIDTAHGLGLMVLLDVVYNHFGPDGNYLGAYASPFFRADIHTPWGNAIDFRQPHVRRFFIENALYWLRDYRFDGLRFDAVHAIDDDTFLPEMAAEIRAAFTGRHIHLILENEHNNPSLLRAMPGANGYDAQWADDWHHCVHVMLTGESEGYYGDFPNPAAQLARCMAEGFAYQGEASAYAGGAARGAPSAYLPPGAFVICLQNHDQIGNRAMGDRLTTLAHPRALCAAIMLLLLTPQIPMIFMGEEFGARTPFLYFTDHNDELAEAVRRGRRQEFAHFAAFSAPSARAQIPDPNAPATFDACVPSHDDPAIESLYHTCLALRARHIAPAIAGAVSLGAAALGDRGVRAAWRLGNGARLTIAANLGAEDIACPPGEGALLIGPSQAGAAYATSVWLAGA